MKKEIILIRERWHESLLKDAGTFGSLVGTIYVGVYLQSQALQWVGAIMWVVFLCARGTKFVSKQEGYSLEEAAAQIDQWQNEQAEEDIAARKTANQPTPGVIPKDTTPPQKPRR